MRIKSVRIINFRGFEDETIEFTPYTAFVGPNGAGKSTVLAALNVFFREEEFAATETLELCEEDFHKRNTAAPIEITVRFHELSAEAQTDFKHYFRQGELVVSAIATFNPTSKRAPVEQKGQRNVVEAFMPFFKSYDNGAKAQELKDIYSVIKTTFPLLPNETVKDKMRDALRSYEEKHPELCSLQTSSVKFYGFSGGDDKLNKYVQWVYVPAVRDVANENVDRKTAALGKLLRYTVKATTNFEDELSELRQQTRKQYSELVNKKQDVLASLSNSLTTKLSTWAHPGATATLKWEQDNDTAVKIDEPTIKMFAGESGFEGEITRFGNGFQRSYLLAVLQELASVTNTGAGPTLILSCEEPELFQHPPQARHLAHVFQSLSESNTQIIVTTHSPHFVFGRHFESVRMVRRAEGLAKAVVTSSKIADTAKAIASAKSQQVPLPIDAQQAKLQQALQPRLSEMFFADRVVLVEGIEDVAFLTSWLIANGQWEHCRQKGMHIVPVDGKENFVEPLALCAELRIPHYLIYDSDSDAKPEHKQEHERDNAALLRLMGQDWQQPFPSTTTLTDKYTVWMTNIGEELKLDLGQQRFDKAVGAARKKLGKPNGKWGKNPVFIGELVAAVFADQTKPECSMDRLCDWLVAFCDK